MEITVDKKKFSILYVDDEQSNLNAFYNTFRRKYKVHLALGAEEGLKIFKEQEIDLVISDQRMPEMTGVEFLKKAMLMQPAPNRILITAYTDFGALKDAVNEARIYQYIQKPWKEEEIHTVIDDALEVYQLKKKNIELLRLLEIKNAELKKLNVELLKIDQIKIQFLQIISHEIRTPLNGLMGVTQLIRECVSDEHLTVSENMIKMLEISAARLEQFLLKAEKITQFKIGEVKLNTSQVRFSELVYTAIQKVQSQAADKQIEIVFEEQYSGEVTLDEDFIGLSVFELLVNAVNFSNPLEQVLVRCQKVSGGVCLIITDYGEGFPKEVLEKLSDLFTTSESISDQGTGLSIPLIHLIMDAHNGTIHVTNNNKGATVELFFPG